MSTEDLERMRVTIRLIMQHVEDVRTFLKAEEEISMMRNRYLTHAILQVSDAVEALESAHAALTSWG